MCCLQERIPEQFPKEEKRLLCSRTRGQLRGNQTIEHQLTIGKDYKVTNKAISKNIFHENTLTERVLTIR